MEMPEFLEGVEGQLRSLHAQITGVDLSGATPEVSFTVDDQDGTPFPLTANRLRFTIAKLVPADGQGSSSHWQSYIHRSEAHGEGEPGATDVGFTTTQATSESASAGQLSRVDAGFVYRFATDITDVQAPVAVAYDETLVHRVALQISGGGLPTANAVHSWRPSDGATYDDGIDGRRIVTTATCNTCHNRLALHGGGRVDVDYCVTCHNPGSTDAHSGEPLDFKVMIHRIHSGRHLPSVQAGGQFVIYGYRNSAHDYAEVGFPQEVTNCRKCHTDGDEATPQAALYKERPTAQACGSCHDLTDFPSGENHAGGARADNQQCAGCHPADSIDAVHADPAALAAAAFRYDIDGIEYDAGSRELAVDIAVRNPLAGDAPYDLTASPEFTTGAGVSRLGLLVGWDTGDYSNQGTAGPGRPISLDALDPENPPVDNGDGSFRLTTTLPEGAYGSGVVAIEGHPAGADADGNYTLRVPVRSAFDHFAITDQEAQPRRAAVDVRTKCDNCHGALSMHGANRNDEAQVCVICHNPNATDIARRPDDHTLADGTPHDGRKESSIDFKRMIHGIHAAGKREDPYVVFGFGNREHVFGEEEVTFPGLLSQCDTCHISDAYTLPLSPEVLPTTVDTAPSAATKAQATPESLADPADDLNISPTAAVCSACHDTSLAEAHMEQNGANFAGTDAEILR